MGEKGQLVVTGELISEPRALIESGGGADLTSRTVVMEAVGVQGPHTPREAAGGETFCTVQLGEHQPIRTKAIKLSEKPTFPRGCPETRLCVLFAYMCPIALILYVCLAK